MQMKTGFAVFLLLFSPVIFAESVTLSWTAPTQNTDGTPLTDLDGYKIYYGLTSGGPFPSEVDVTDETVTTYVLDGLSTGTYFFVATAYNTAGIESDYSGEATKTLQSIPTAPTNLVVAGNLTAYAISQTENALVLYPVGQVPAGTPCDGSMRVNEAYVVPRSAVNWVGTARPQVVLAACGSG